MKEKDKFLKILAKHKLPRIIQERAASLDRVEFFDEIFADKAYTGESLPIGFGEKSDDINTLAAMIKILKPDKNWRLLEVGTGSGYSSALLSSCVKELVTVDYYEQIALKAKERVLIHGFTNTKFYAGDFTENYEEIGMFDAIIVFAGCRKRPIQLFNTLKPGGVMVLPMGPPHQQQVVRFVLPEEDEPENSLERCGFYDFCLYESIKGVYGWA